MSARQSRDRLPYRRSVGAMVINSAGLVFVGNRANRAGDGDDAWQMPQGGVDKGEDLLAAVKRELFEETDIRSVELLAEAPDWYSYDVPEELAGTRFHSKWRGQAQKWFAFRFVGKDEEINIHSPGGGRHKPEFDAWRWERASNIPALIVPFKRRVYEQVCAAFASFTTLS